jgi:hypothetical protein
VSSSTAVLGQSPAVPTMIVSTVAAAVAIVGSNEATTVDIHHRLSVFQL